MFLPRCRSQRTPAQKALSQIWNVEDKRHPYDAVTAFQATYGAKFAKANARITDDVELLACYDLRHRPLPEQDQQGSRLPGCRNRHGLQADRSRAGTVPSEVHNSRAISVLLRPRMMRMSTSSSLAPCPTTVRAKWRPGHGDARARSCSVSRTNQTTKAENMSWSDLRVPPCSGCGAGTDASGTTAA